MVKSWISVIVACIILAGGTVFEQIYVSNTFKEFKENTVKVYDLTKSGRATSDDVVDLQDYWYGKKKILHIFIPHNDIKEIDLWLAESRVLVEEEKFEDALSKLDVVIELTEQIPKTFLIKIENIL